jgi:hypothetical protein
MIHEIARIYEKEGTARAVAQSINKQERFAGHGPFRFNSDRSDFRFYLDHEIAYFRLTELIAPQAISQWYLGSGATVGLQTISGLYAIDRLVREREAGKFDFVVWPLECLDPDGTKHVIAESYPSICPKFVDTVQCRNNHQKDACRVLQMLLLKRNEGKLRDLFRIREQQFGRRADIDFWQQVQFEGFILGIH